MLYVNPQLHSGFKDFQLSPGADRRETEALKEFEQLFLFQMLKEMRKTVPDSGLFGSGMKRQYFEEMLDDVMAGEMAESGQLGIARQMAEQLRAKQALIVQNTTVDAGLGTGISVKNLHAGLPVTQSVPVGIEVPESNAGVGISTTRAHERYQEHRSLP